MKINKDYISKNNTYDTNIPKYIVIHNTDNYSQGADAYTHAHAQFLGNFQGMSAHYYVDDKEIYQAADLKRGCWHVGVDYGGKFFGVINNRNSIGIEMCVQNGYDFNKAFRNTIELVKYLMNITGITSDHVVQHYDVCLKNCPSEIRKHGMWEYFQAEIGYKNNRNFEEGFYKVTANVLNIRTGPGTQYEIIGTISDHGAYTIVQVKNNWGKLKSRAGWICLNYTERLTL